MTSWHSPNLSKSIPSEMTTTFYFQLSDWAGFMQDGRRCAGRDRRHHHAEAVRWLGAPKGHGLDQMQWVDLGVELTERGEMLLLIFWASGVRRATSPLAQQSLDTVGEPLVALADVTAAVGPLGQVLYGRPRWGRPAVNLVHKWMLVW